MGWGASPWVGGGTLPCLNQPLPSCRAPSPDFPLPPFLVWTKYPLHLPKLFRVGGGGENLGRGPGKHAVMRIGGACFKRGRGLRVTNRSLSSFSGWGGVRLTPPSGKLRAWWWGVRGEGLSSPPLCAIIPTPPLDPTLSSWPGLAWPWKRLAGCLGWPGSCGRLPFPPAEGKGGGKPDSCFVEPEDSIPEPVG